MLLKGAVKLVVALNSNKDPGEIAGGAAFALALALIPSGNLLWVALFLLTVFLRVNIAVELFFLGLFKIPVPLVDPLLDKLGLLVLTTSGLGGLFTALADLPLVAFTRFNNTVVTGALIAAVALWIPIYLLLRKAVALYRSHVKDKIAESPFIKWFRRLPLVSRVAKLTAEVMRASRTGR